MLHRYPKISRPSLTRAWPRIISLFLIIVVISLLSACGSPSTDSTADVTADPSQSEVAAKATAADLQFGAIKDDFVNLSDWQVRREKISRLILYYLGDMPLEALPWNLRCCLKKDLILT